MTLIQNLPRFPISVNINRSLADSSVDLRELIEDCEPYSETGVWYNAALITRHTLLWFDVLVVPLKVNDTLSLLYKQVLLGFSICSNVFINNTASQKLILSVMEEMLLRGWSIYTAGYYTVNNSVNPQSWRVTKRWRFWRSVRNFLFMFRYGAEKIFHLNRKCWPSKLNKTATKFNSCFFFALELRHTSCIWQWTTQMLPKFKYWRLYWFEIT